MSGANSTQRSITANSKHNIKRNKKEDVSRPNNYADELESTAMTLRIKCTSPGINDSSNPTGDYEVVTHSTAIVSTLKETVRNGIGQDARGRYLRLIAGGRLLAPDSAPISKFNINDGDCVHAVLAAAGVRGGLQASMSRGLAFEEGTRSRNNGSGINQTGLIVPLRSDDNFDDDIEAGIERRGFDRLRDSGLTRDEISAIRLYFSQQVDRFIERQTQTRSDQNQTNNNQNDSNLTSLNTTNSTSSSSSPQNNQPSSRHDMEDAWMNAQGPHSEFWLNLNTNDPLLIANRRISFGQDDFTTLDRSSHNIGSDRDFIWGFTLGYFVGFMMMFFVWMPTVSHKQKLGILCGISLKLTLTVIQKTENSASDFNV